MFVQGIGAMGKAHTLGELRRSGYEARSVKDELRTNLEQLLRNRIARDYFGHRLSRLKVLEGLVSRLGGEAVADQKLG